jgi:aryl-alcohol dehydrogenase-like predicted oxidoreductase
MNGARREALRSLAACAGLLAMNRAMPQPQSPLVTRPIPATGEALPVIGLGTWQVFDAGSDRAARDPLREVLATFARSGGRVIDSSPMYGSSESVVGDLAAELGLAGKLFVATKVWTSGREAGIRQMETSFKRLRVERMDLMQVHNLVDVAVHTKTLADWKAKGRVRSSASRITPVRIRRNRVAEDRPVRLPQINYSLAELNRPRACLSRR